MTFGLGEQRYRLGVEMLGKQLKENLFMFLPAETVLGVTHLEAFKMQLSEEALIGVAVRLAENRKGPVAFVSASLNQAIAAEE